MKKSKLTKALLMVLCAALLVAGSIMGTLAYLTSRESVTNTFTVGNVQIEVDEEKVNPDGTPVDPAERTDKGNQYHLLPGQTYTKDPTMTVKANSENSYVRMKVTITHYKELAAVLTKLEADYDKDFKLVDFVNGEDTELWQPYGDPVVDLQANTVTYEFRYRDIVEKSDADQELKPLFESFTVPGEVNADQLATIQGLSIIAEGHAIQAASFDNAEAAWAAFDVQFEAESKTANP